MKCLDETPADISKRMRKLAGGMTNPADAEAILRYASWIEANPNAAELQDLGEQSYLQESQKRH